MSYTLPNGRRATPKQEQKRLALLAARASCPDCKRAADSALAFGDYRPGKGPADLHCERHQSL